MDYLYQRNRWVAKQEGRPYRPAERPIVAGGKRVVVIGGGDTGMDCVSNALREGARDAIILDVYPELPVGGRDDRTPWPEAPKRTLSTYALDEGGERRWSKQVTRLEGADGRVVRVHGRSVTGTSSRDLEAVPGSEFAEDADLVLIAIGFSGPEKPLLAQLAVDVDRRGNVKAGAYATSVEGVFAAGDARMGQSLVVWAIAEGRKCARVVDRYLIGLRTAEPPLEPEEALEPHTGELEMPSDAVYGPDRPPTGS
jgi:glutamate synthase (NADPH/NADH) small chain